jgi:hypothetical protein
MMTFHQRWEDMIYFLLPLRQQQYSKKCRALQKDYFHMPMLHHHLLADMLRYRHQQLKQKCLSHRLEQQMYMCQGLYKIVSL